MEHLPYEEFVEEFSKTFDDAIAQNYAKIEEITEWKKDLLENRFPALSQILREYKDADAKLDEMIENRSKELEELQRKAKESKEESDRAKKKLDDLHKDVNKFKYEHNKTKKQCEKLVEKKAEQEEFKTFLNELKSKLQIYVSLTNVKWDFETDGNVIRGYVNNKFNRKTKAFSYDLNKHSQDEIVERIWADIYTVYDDCEEKEKENTPCN